MVKKKGKLLASKKEHMTFYAIRHNKTKKFFAGIVVCSQLWVKDPLFRAVCFKRKSDAKNKARVYDLKDYAIVKVRREVIRTWREIK